MAKGIRPLRLTIATHQIPTSKPIEELDQQPRSRKLWVLALVNSVVMMVLALVLPSTDTANHSTDKDTSYQVVWVLFAVCAGVLLVEIVWRMLLLRPVMFLRIPLNWLDVFLLFACVGVLTKPGVFPGGVALLRLFRVLEVASEQWPEACKGPVLLARSIMFSPRVLSVLFAYVLFWIFWFSLMGLEFYSGSMGQRCVVSTTNDTVLPETWCGDTGEGWGSSLRCHAAQNHTCNMEFGNLDHGLRGFDSIGQSSLIVFSVMAVSDWWLYVFALSQSEYVVSVLYPIGIMLIITFIAINLFVAAVAYGFSKLIGSEVQDSTHEVIVESDATVVPSTPDDDPSVIVQHAPPVCESSWCESSTDTTSVRFRVAAVLKSRPFELAIIGLVILNSALLASQQANMEPWHEEMLEYGEMSFTSLFVLEACLKLSCFGPREYFSDNWNKFDFSLVVLGIIDLIVGIVDLTQLRNLRLFRSLRVNRALRRVDNIQRMFDALANSANIILWIFLLVLFLQFVFSLIMHQLYAFKFDHFDPSPRANFNTVLSSCFCVAQIVTGDGLESIMYNTMQDINTGWLGAPMVVTVFVVCNFLVINLFVAAILQALSGQSTPDESEIEEGDDESIREENKVDKSRECATKEEKAWSDSSLWIFGPESKLRVVMQKAENSKIFQTVTLIHVIASNVILVFDTKSMNDGPYATSWFKEAEGALSLYFAAFFTLELLVHAIASNFVLGPGTKKSKKLGRTPYLRQSPFTKLDFTALVLAYAQIISKAAFPDASLLRVGRVARPLRLFGRAPVGARRVVESFVHSLPLMFNAIVIANAIWFMFAVSATNLFSGGLYSCNDSTRTGQLDCVGLYLDPETSTTVPRVWANAKRNFDHVGHAYLALLDVASTDSWSEVLYACTDITSEGLQPSANSQPLVGIFFLIFMVFGAFVALNLFVTVVLDCYCFMIACESGVRSSLQAQYADVERLLVYHFPQEFPKRPSRELYFGLRTYCYDLCVPWDKRTKEGSRCMKLIQRNFSNIVLCVLSIDLLSMATRHKGMSDEWANAVLVISHVCAGLYALELTIKLVAYSPQEYLKSSLNKCDALVVVACVVTAPLDQFYAKVPNLLRGLRVLKEIPQFWMLTNQLFQSVLRIGNVFLVLLLVHFCYAVAGVEFFGSVRRGLALDATSNFDNMPNAMLSLIRVTLTSWVHLRLDCEVASPSCTVDQDCGSVMAKPFFITLLILNGYILVNTFVAVVLTDFSWLFASEQGASDDAQKGVFCDKHMQQIRAAWEEMDPRGRGFIIEADLKAFVESIEPPLGFKGNPITVLQLAQLKQDISSYPLAEQGKCRYRDILSLLALNCLGGAAVPDGHHLRVFEETSAYSAPKLLRFKSIVRAVIQLNRASAYKHQPRASNEQTIPSISFLDFQEKIQKSLGDDDMTIGANSLYSPGKISWQTLRHVHKVVRVDNDVEVIELDNYNPVEAIQARLDEASKLPNASLNKTLANETPH